MRVYIYIYIYQNVHIDVLFFASVTASNTCFGAVWRPAWLRTTLSLESQQVPL